MKLLILTQKVDIDDDILGFFHGWILEFAKHCEMVTVICLFKGRYELPDNVKVLSLGKEEVRSKKLEERSKKLEVRSDESLPFAKGVPVRGRDFNFQFFNRIKYLFRFYKYIWQERGNYDGVFVHMNQVYVILGGLFWRMWRKRISLWYAHKQVSWSLRIAEKLVDNIFTASKESFRLVSKKIRVMGHGINTDIFRPLENRQANNSFKILTVGRISPIKDIGTLILAVAELKNENCGLEIVGAPGTVEQEKYLQEMKDLAVKKGIDERVKFVGSVPNREVLKYYQSADLFVNTSNTGSLDKAILEAMACGVIVVTSNDSMQEMLTEFGDGFTFKSGDYKRLASNIKDITKLNTDERKNLGTGLRQIVVEKHNLGNLVLKILKK